MSRLAFAEYLTERQREQFAERLGRLRTLLLVTPAERYDHGTYFFTRALTRKAPASVAIKECGTSACALGIATASKSKFPGLKLKFANSNVNDYSLVVADNAFSIEDEADDYFGPGAYDLIFSLFAVKGTRDGADGRAKTVSNIERFMRDRLGYEPA